MFDKIQRDRFWLVLGIILIGLFVIQKERGVTGGSAEGELRQTRIYDRGGMNKLVEQAIEIPVRAAPADARPLSRPAVQYASWGNTSHDDLITGSIAVPPAAIPRPLARPGRDGRAVEVAALPAPSGRYYAQVGSYSSIDRASRRYFDILAREPDLQGEERVSIDTARYSGEEVHRVRMGPFSDEGAARAACARAQVPADECAVIHLN
ncbi:SPOR domain-containing protein [Parvibaculum sp.]|jgi:cell division protein FtsN|uniref:SPOR domain-containing protein n=1 Tax=Parvibaculum sp. TaxID=2024848 RepID=UPI003C743F72